MDQESISAMAQGLQAVHNIPLRKAEQAIAEADAMASHIAGYIKRELLDRWGEDDVGLFATSLALSYMLKKMNDSAASLATIGLTIIREMEK